MGCRYRKPAVGVIIAVFTAVALAGCAVPAQDPGFPRIDFSRRPADWPELEIDMRYVPSAHIARMCDLEGSGMEIHGCVAPSFCLRRCTIYVINDAFLQKSWAGFVMEH